MKTDSALYRGHVGHARRTPLRHGFRYPLWMVWADINALEDFLGQHWAWGRRWRPVVLRDSDYLDSSDQILSKKVRARAAEAGLDWQQGRVMMLAQPRMFGWCFNPLVLYWHFPVASDQPDSVLAEVSNTPWRERHWYPLPLAADADGSFSVRHAKAFHVSPFMNLDMDYHWRLTLADDRLEVQIDNWRGDQKLFSVSMNLTRLAASSRAMGEIIPEFGWQSLKTSLRIYRQAWTLWRRGVPFVPHPDRSAGGPGG